MKKTIFILPLIATAFAISGCNKSSNVKDTDLMHHHFVLVKANGQELTSDEYAELEFGENMTITGKMCNLFSGKVALDNNVIRGAGLSMTKMVCPDSELSKLDAVIEELIVNGAKIELTKDQLILKNEDNELTYKVKELM
ncbi:META domain-containing protein [Gilliamella sp. B2776]|uniref:META domain-containing protein n=1 Tax=unclassified Gilliamella TaxID=2685620 RepID=UPI00226A4DFE|nr:MULTISPECIES: META domain-containing protein [unclassified Gilliamella]MCX8650858.1 META domain-containing protein [Gilliamella sp. B2779]MCX8653913.1 META domain-containing protein [Gilliamella sp. B2737]MCX8657274.1 META domain-containing protein [Gilliamella sp. B2894]MCX8665886.1 META domain-containing protein [Gilliamella sp. B2887]MCX8691485.1 META domain-containing protein [Gilliamella sp. B2776]